MSKGCKKSRGIKYPFAFSNQRHVFKLVFIPRLGLPFSKFKEVRVHYMLSLLTSTYWKVFTSATFRAMVELVHDEALAVITEQW